MTRLLSFIVTVVGIVIAFWLLNKVGDGIAHQDAVEKWESRK